MSNHDDDDGAPPMEPMTAEEEAELLAQYGTANTFYDDLIDIQAPSQYRSHMYHSSALFLTGTSDEDPAASPQERSEPAAIIDELDCRAPLELYVLRHLTTTSAAAPSSYSEALSCAMQALDEYHRTEATKKASSAPLQKSEAEQAALRELLGHSGGNDNTSEALRALLGTSDGDEDEEKAMNRHIDGLLHEVDAELQRTNFHYDPATDEVFQARLKELQEVYALEPLHDEAFEDDAQLLDELELAAIKENIDSRAPAVYLNEEEVVEQQQLAAEIDKRNAFRKQQMEELEEKKIALFKEGDKEAEQMLGGNARLPPATVTSSVLEHISNIEARDSELEKQATVQLREHMTATRNALEARETRQRQKAQVADAQGKMVFQEFSSKMDVVLPPATINVVNPLVSVAAPSASSSAVPSLADLKKKSRREEFLSRREAIERRLMRDEEARVESFLRQLEIIRVQNEDRVENFKNSEMNLRRAVLSEEAIAHVEITVREERQRLTILQFLQQRAAQRQAKAVSEILHDYESLRESFAHMETHEWADLVLSCKTDRTTIEARAAAVEEELMKLERIMLQEMVTRRTEFTKKSHQRATLSTSRTLERALTQDLLRDQYPSFSDMELFGRAAHIDSCGFGSRIVAAQDVLQSRNNWSVKFKKESVSSLQAIHMAQSAALPHRAPQKKKTAIAETKRPQSSVSPLPESSRLSSQPDEIGGVVLNAKLLRKLIPMQLAEAAVNMSRCPQVFYALSLALESITTIDFGSVADLSVEPFVSEQHRRPNESIDGNLKQFSALAGIRIAPFVKNLDLSSNELTTLPFDQLCNVFPSLTHVKVAHNQIVRLFPQEVSHSQNIVSSQIFSLDVSANQMESAEGVSLFPELRNLTIYSNRIRTLQDLKDCARLYDVEMARNQVDSLDGADTLTTLRTLDLSYNRVQDLVPLSKSLLLQRLFLSSNRIMAFPVGNSLIFLRQLYLNENQLTSIPSEVRWMPFLADVHLESNKLTSIEGLKHCTQLQILKLSFNQFSEGVTDVSVLSACKRMEVFSINDNPMMRSAATAQDVHRCALQMFPRLREYNNEVVSTAMRQHARDRQILLDGMPVFGSVVARCPSALESWARHGTVVPFVRCASQLFMEHSSSSSCSTSPQDASQESLVSILAVSFERQISHMQREYESIYVDGNRKYQQALAVEEGISSKRRDGQCAAMYVHSSVLASRNYSDSLACSQKHLEFLRENVTVGSQLNVHTVSTPYEVKARRYREQRARERLSSWITGRVLIGKARQELEALRDASEIGRRKRQQTAALVVQHFGRGLIGRKRVGKLWALARAEDDDDMLFTKVTFDDPATNHHAPSAFSSLAGKTSVVPFQKISSLKQGNSNIGIDGALPRISSAPHDVEDGSRGQGRRPQSNPGLASSLPTAEPSPPPKSSRSALDDEWGAALAEQLRKKQKKMDRARSDMIRKEYLSDPLKAKKLAGN